MSPTGRASPARRALACQFNSLIKNVCVYMRGELALLGEISLSRAGNFPYKRDREGLALPLGLGKKFAVFIVQTQIFEAFELKDYQLYKRIFNCLLVFLPKYIGKL